MEIKNHIIEIKLITQVQTTSENMRILMKKMRKQTSIRTGIDFVHELIVLLL